MKTLIEYFKHCILHGIRKGEQPDDATECDQECYKGRCDQCDQPIVTRDRSEVPTTCPHCGKIVNTTFTPAICGVHLHDVPDR